MIAQHNRDAVARHLRDQAVRLQAAAREIDPTAERALQEAAANWLERATLLDRAADHIEREGQMPACRTCGDTGRVALIAGPGDGPCSCGAKSEEVQDA